jgi:hypothetical protein
MTQIALKPKNDMLLSAAQVRATLMIVFDRGVGVGVLGSSKCGVTGWPHRSCDTDGAGPQECHIAGRSTGECWTTTIPPSHMQAIPAGRCGSVCFTGGARRGMGGHMVCRACVETAGTSIANEYGSTAQAVEPHRLYDTDCAQPKTHTLFSAAQPVSMQLLLLEQAREAPCQHHGLLLCRFHTICVPLVPPPPPCHTHAPHPSKPPIKLCWVMYLPHRIRRCACGTCGFPNAKQF